MLQWYRHVNIHGQNNKFIRPINGRTIYEAMEERA
jgi:hypothetical protein